jgi:glucose/arabinose dehydrogenase
MLLLRNPALWTWFSVVALALAACSPADPPPTTAMPTPSPVPSTPAPHTTSPHPTADATPRPEPPQAVEVQAMTEGLHAPISITHAGDASGQLYVNEQDGRIMIVEPTGTLDPQPFLEIQARVGAGGERGLLGLAFHPDFAQNGRFFVHYSAAGSGDTVLSEFRAEEDRGLRDSEQILLTVSQPAGNHNGGQLAFGPDGHLYMALGDGGGGGDTFDQGQDPFTLLGTLLRLDVSQPGEYRVPPDNPFADGVDGAPEVWAWGLRNPWRFSFDRETGDLYIADVGQNAWEEVNRQPASSPGGENYGWPLMEGSHCFAIDPCEDEDLTGPIVEYANDQENCSVTGGYVYRGSASPSLTGSYLFGDYCSGHIFLVAPDELAAATPGQPLTPRVVARTDLQISAFGEDEAGEVYVANHRGAIYRIVVPDEGS